jgi:hypothetical protein
LDFRPGQGFVTAAAVLACFALAAPAVDAQELEPRLFANTPVGVNFIAVGYGHSSGNVLLDPTIPIEDLDSNIHLVFARYTRTLDFFGLSSKVRVMVPFSGADWEGSVTDAEAFGDLVGLGRQERHVTGFGDTRFTWAVNLVGSPAIRRSEFGEYRQGTIVGAVVHVIAPTGQYDSDKLLNLSSNRWVFRPQIGVSQAVGNWTFEGAASAFLFTDNEDFFGGNELAQEPLYALQGHAVYGFRPGFWLGVGAAYGRGGTTFVNGVVRNTLQSTYRIGATFAYALTPQHGLSVAVTTSVRSRAGADFDSLGVAYQYMWGGDR